MHRQLLRGDVRPHARAEQLAGTTTRLGRPWSGHQAAGAAVAVDGEAVLGEGEAACLVVELDLLLPAKQRLALLIEHPLPAAGAEARTVVDADQVESIGVDEHPLVTLAAFAGLAFPGRVLRGWASRPRAGRSRAAWKSWRSPSPAWRCGVGASRWWRHARRATPATRRRARATRPPAPRARRPADRRGLGGTSVFTPLS